MTTQDGARGDQAVAAQPRRQPPDQGGENRPVRPVPAWFRVGAAEYGDLWRNNQQLDDLCGRPAACQQDESEYLLEDQIQSVADPGVGPGALQLVGAVEADGTLLLRYARTGEFA